MQISIKKTLGAALILGLTGCASMGGTGNGDSDLVDHPKALTYDDQELSFFDADDYRVDLVDGNVAYVVPNDAFPLVRINIVSPAGEYLLTASDNPATGNMAVTMLRDGGTRDLTPEELDERLAFLATNIGFSSGSTQSSANLDTLADNLDESLDLMFDMLTESRMDAERLQINKEKALETMRRRNDDTRTIEPRVWGRLLRGEEFFTNQMSTESDIEAIEPDMLRDYANTVFGSGQLVIAVSGAVDKNAIVAKLNQQLKRLPPAAKMPEIPTQTEPMAAGVYGINKDDVNQTRVRIGHPGIKRDNPDYYAVQVMNDILGGGGFTSRITKRVRSDEGLAYSAGSRFSAGRHWDGEFRAFFQSKNPSVPQAVAIVLEEIEKIQNTPVSEQELQTAHEAQLTFLADLYASPRRMANRFVTDHINDEDSDYWRDYESKIRAVTLADVQRVAQKYLKQDQLRILLVGKLEEATAGDGTHGSLSEVTGNSMQKLSLRDPMTLEPLSD